MNASCTTMEKKTWITCSPVAKRPWEYFLPSFKKVWTSPVSAKGALTEDLVSGPFSPEGGWLHGRLSKEIMWVIWNERNKRICEDKKKEIHNFISDVQEALFEWSRGCALFKDLNLHEFIAGWEETMV